MAHFRPANVSCGGKHKLMKMTPSSANYVADGGWKCDECENDGVGDVLHCVTCDAYDRCNACHAKHNDWLDL